MSVPVIDRLRCFNRKERDHLAKFAYCGHKHLDLSAEFRNELEGLLRTRIGKIPQDDGVFFGMDYHLNWLFCAIWAAHKTPNENGAYENPEGHWRLPKRRKKDGKTVVVHEAERLFEPNQEDVDFIVAFHQPSDNRLKIILIEAKLDTGWSTLQFVRKVGRIENIALACKQAGFDPCIDWSIVLLSPRKPTKKLLAGSAKTSEPNFSVGHFPAWVFLDAGKAEDSIPHLVFPTLPPESIGRKKVKQLASSGPGIGFWEIEG